MKYVKKILVILFLALSLFLTSCIDNPLAIDKKIKKNGEKIMEAFIAEDDKEVLKFFASDIQDYHRTKTMSEIQQAFDFIDGKIVSYDYQEGAREKRQSYGNIEYYDRTLEFINVTTDTGNIYTIYVDYTYIWKGKPDREGICQIRLFKNDDRDNQFFIGKTNFDDWK